MNLYYFSKSDSTYNYGIESSDVINKNVYRGFSIIQGYTIEELKEFDENFENRVYGILLKQGDKTSINRDKPFLWTLTTDLNHPIGQEYARSMINLIHDNIEKDIKVEQNAKIISRLENELDMTANHYNSLAETLRIRTEKELVKMELKNEELRRFTYIVAHDFKSPVRNIVQLHDMITENGTEGFDPEQLYALDKISLISQRLMRLVSEFQTLCKISESSSLELDKKKTNFEDLIEDCLDSYQNELNKQGFDISKQEHPKLFVNSNLFQQVYMNLISNVLRYNDTENPTLSFNCKKVNGSSWRFSVSNSYHSDIPNLNEEKMLKDIFHPLKRYHAEGEGTGMGLTICQKIITLHGGKIWAELKDGLFIINFEIPERKTK